MFKNREIFKNTQIQNSFSHSTQKNLVFQEYHIRSQHAVATLSRNSQLAKIQNAAVHQSIKPLAIGQAQSQHRISKYDRLKIYRLRNNT